MLWRIELKFGMSLSCYEHLIKIECRQFPSSFVGVMPLLELKILEIHSFPQFSPTCFDILRWNFAYDFILMYFRSSLSVVNFCQFLLYVRLQTGRIMVWWCPSGSPSDSPSGLHPSVRVSVRPFSALFSYILWHIELKFCTWLQFLKELCLCEFRIGNTQFSTLFSYMLWHIELKFCTWLCFTVLHIKFECHHMASIFEGVIPLCELRMYKIHSFLHFSPTCFDILSWNFAHDFLLMYYRTSLSVVPLRQSLKELCLFWNLKYRKCTVFRSFLLHTLTYWAESLHMTLF